jgi:glycolate oxidase iron-sulfur subunit
MQTHFSLAQLADPANASSNTQLRACVHCGFCTATCPTYLLLGDELDSPRGRIYLIKEMLEKQLAPPPMTVKHLDRCLTCLSCMTTCPSGVNYMHLVDHARAYIEDHKGRPLPERMFRAALVKILSNRTLFRASLFLAALAKPFQFILPKQLKAMVGDAPAPKTPGPAAHPNVFPAQGRKRGRMALLSGCVQPVVSPGIDEAVVRLMTRHGVEIVVAAGQGCCGALAHHMGDHAGAKEKAKINIAAWEAEIAKGGLDAIVISASGCGTVLKDYGFIFRDDPEWAARAARISALSKDVTEVLATLELMPPVIPAGQKVAYHSACSLQHGQKITGQPRELLARAGFDVQDVPEGHICCGSAGTYSMLQPELSGQLRARKLSNIAATEAPIVAAGNIGCITHLSPKNGEAGARMIHTAELLDWATGGPKPAGL